jgi:hypothetical protein
MLARIDTKVDSTELAIAMYIVLSQVVYGPAIEKVAVTIRKLINQSTCRTDANGKADRFEIAKRCFMSGEPGDDKLNNPIARNAMGEAVHGSSSSSTHGRGCQRE